VETRPKIPNSVLRRIREEERHESRAEFAQAVVEAGERGLACDARHVARWEDGDVTMPRPAYRRALEAVTGRAFAELGFSARNAIAMPSPERSASDRVSFRMDAEGNVWATVDETTFLVGTTDTLLRAGVESTLAPPVLGAAGPLGFTAFVQQRWPGLRLSRQVPAYGVDATALLPHGRTVEGAGLRVHVGHARTANGRAVVDLAGDRSWAEFSRGTGRGLLIGVTETVSATTHFAIDARAAGRRTDAEAPDSVGIPLAYELDDFTYGLIWACANLDDALQADDHELASAEEYLAACEKGISSAVPYDIAGGLGAIPRMWLGSNFCARHIMRNLADIHGMPTFWTREQRGEEACTWLLFDHKYPYLRSMRRARGERSTRMFCLPPSVVRDSPVHERVLLFLAIALIEAEGIQVKVCDDPAYADLQGFVLGDDGQAIIANWLREEGMWHIARTYRSTTLRDATRYVAEHSVIDGADPAYRLQALAHYLDLDWSWLRTRCRALGQAGCHDLLRPRSRLVSVEGIDIACAFVGRVSRIAN
jgi:hypothetical protein